MSSCITNITVIMMMMMLQVMYVFRECSKFTSVFTLCALSVDRFLATYHQLGRYRQIRVGVVVCVCIWLACFVVSSPYWISVHRTGSSSSLLPTGSLALPWNVHDVLPPWLPQQEVTSSLRPETQR